MKTIEDLFERCIPVPHTGCWLWLQAITRDGYGWVSFRGTQCKAHRAAFQLANGDIPKGLVVRHTCNVPACCNPSHLIIGTQRDNIDDMLRSGRSKSPKRHAPKSEDHKARISASLKGRRKTRESINAMHLTRYGKLPKRYAYA